MSSTAVVTFLVRAGRAGRYTDWQTTSELRRSWQQQALCGGVDSGCAIYALVNRELHGVWGGLTEADRRRRLTRP